MASTSSNLPQPTLETPTSASWYTGSSVPNRISGWSYDPAGNVLQVGGMTRSFTYDAEDRHVTVTINSNTSNYTYNGLGQRVEKVAGGVTTVYVYDAFGNLDAEYSSNPPASPCGTQTCYLTLDHLGSTRMLTDTAGTNGAASSNAARYDYLPFGGELLANVNGRTTAMGYLATPDTTNPKFTGQMRDPETYDPNGGTALDWFVARAMSGAQGRFQSVDPGNAGVALGDPQTWNAYAYVGNNPLSYTDPSGRFIEAAGPLSAAGPVGTIVGGLIDLGELFGALFGLFGGGGGSPPPPNWANVLQTPVNNANPASDDGPAAMAGINPWYSQCGFIYGSVCGVAPYGDFIPSPGSVPSFSITHSEKIPSSPNGVATFGGTPNNMPSCFGNFTRNWGDLMNPLPSDFDPAELGRKGLEGASIYFQAKAWQHAASRALSYPNKSSIFRPLLKYGKFAEEAASLPVYTVGAGIWAYKDDLIERHEGTCRPFSWE